MSAAAKNPAPKKGRPHPVPVPRNRWHAPRREAEAERVASGYTSVRVTKRTAELLRRLVAQAVAAQRQRAGGPFYAPAIGLDELLYWDALQRLGELPEGVE